MNVDGQMNNNGDLIILEGTIDRVTYRNEENGYSVCVLSTEDGDDITIVGIIPYINEGEIVSVSGKWETHNTYGMQFRVISFEKQLPATSGAIYKYLASGVIHGVGEVTAKKIVGMFGEDTFDVIEHHPEYLADIPGITRRKAGQIHDSFVEQFGMRNLMMNFREHFGPTLIVKMFKKWGANAVDIIHDNPYILCDEIYGIGFEKADAYAETLGYDRNSDKRIASGVRYVLTRNAVQNGHVFVPLDKLVPVVSEVLGVDQELVKSVYEKGIPDVITIRHGGTPCIYLKEFYASEAYCASKLKLIDQVCLKEHIQDTDRLISLIEAEEGIVYAKAQRRAINYALANGVMVLTGGPGTGKTTIIRAIISLADRMGIKVALAAPTVRAAKRMSEATQHEAKTIHRMLEMKYTGDEDRPVFGRDEKNLLEEQLFIIDETSMVDILLFASLLKAIKPGARLILIGDADQLPSVGAGNVLCDIIDSDRFCTVRLSEIFRQASESRIVTNAHAINSGELPVLDDKKGDFFFIEREDESEIPKTITDLCKNRLPRAYGEGIRPGIQVITPSRKGVAGTDALNGILQTALNPASKDKKEKRFRDRIYRVGDKVMQIKNNYDIAWKKGNEDGIGIFNGDIGVIRDINEREQIMVIDFDERITEYEMSTLDELEHAYAITVHKSQGSEYPVVIIPAYGAAPMLLTRNLLYTAVTRAQKMVVIVGRSQIIMQMVSNKKLANRYTGLRRMLEV